MLVPVPEAQERIDALSAESDRLRVNIDELRAALRHLERRRAELRADLAHIYQTCERVETDA